MGNKSSKPKILPNEIVCTDFDSFLGIYNSFQVAQPTKLVGDYKFEKTEFDSDDESDDDDDDDEKEKDPDFPPYKLKRRHILFTHYHNHLNQYIIISSMGVCKLDDHWNYNPKMYILEVMIFNFSYKQKKKNKLNNLNKSIKLYKTFYIKCNGYEQREIYFDKQRLEYGQSLKFNFHPKYLYLFITKLEWTKNRSNKDKNNRPAKTSKQYILLYNLNNPISTEKVFQLTVINECNLIFRPLLNENTKYNSYDQEEVEYIFNEQKEQKNNDEVVINLIENVHFMNYKNTEYLVIPYGYNAFQLALFKYDPLKLDTKQTLYIYFWSECRTDRWKVNENAFKNEKIIKYFQTTTWKHCTYFAVSKTNINKYIHIILVFDAGRNKESRREIISIEFNLDSFQFEWNPLNDNEYKAELVYYEQTLNSRQISDVHFLPSNNNFIVQYLECNMSTQNRHREYVRIYKYKETKINQYSSQIKKEFADNCKSKICKYFESNKYGDIGIIAYSNPLQDKSKLYENEIKIFGESSMLMSGSTNSIFKTLGIYLNNIHDIINLIVDMMGIVNGVKIIKLPITKDAETDRYRNYIGSMSSITFSKNHDTMFILESQKRYHLIHVYSTP